MKHVKCLCRSMKRRVWWVTIGCRGPDAHTLTSIKPTDWSKETTTQCKCTFARVSAKLTVWRHCIIYSMCCPPSVHVLCTLHILYVWARLIFPISGKHTPKLNGNLIKRTWCNLDQMLIRSHISSPIRDPSIVILRALCQARLVLPAV